MGTFHLSILVFLPLAAGLVGAFLPARVTRWLVTAATVAVLAIVVWMIADFDKGSGGLHYVTDDAWISELGIRYSLGVDGLSLFLLFLTAVAWVFAARVVGGPRDRAGAPVLLPPGAGRDRRAGRLHRSGPGAVRDLLRPDAGAVLLPGRGVGRPGDAGGGHHQVRDLHAGRLAADAGRRRGAGRAVGRRRAVDLVRALRPDRAHAGARHAVLDLPAVRRRLPGQGAGLPAARLGARHLPRQPRSRCSSWSAPCCPRWACTASCGWWCRSCPTPRSTSRR